MSWTCPPSDAPQADALRPDGVIVTGENRDEALMKIFAEGDCVARAMGRAVAAGWPEAAHEWFKAEAERGSASTALQALVAMQLSIFAGIVAQGLPPFLHAEMVSLYERRVRDSLPRLIADVHAAAGSGGGDD